MPGGSLRRWRTRTPTATTSRCSARTGGVRRRTRPATCCPCSAPGMRLLDVGCGPGTITMDLAELVGPRGRVTALERTEDALGLARAEAQRRGRQRRLRRRRRAGARPRGRLVRRGACPPGAAARRRPGPGTARDGAGVPPGRPTRPISRSARTGSSTCCSTWWACTTSNAPSGRSSPCTSPTTKSTLSTSRRRASSRARPRASLRAFERGDPTHRSDQLREVHGDGARSAADVEQPHPRAEQGQQVAGRVLRRTPPVRAEHRLVVAVGVLVRHILRLPPGGCPQPAARSPSRDPAAGPSRARARAALSSQCSPTSTNPKCARTASDAARPATPRPAPAGRRARQPGQELAHQARREAAAATSGDT